MIIGMQLKYVIDRAIQCEDVESVEEIDKVMDWLEENYLDQYDSKEASKIFKEVITNTFYKFNE